MSLNVLKLLLFRQRPVPNLGRFSHSTQIKRSFIPTQKMSFAPVEQLSSLLWRKVILVDLDNFDVPASVLEQANDTMFIFFASRNGTKDHTRYTNMSNARIIVTKAVGRDAADIQMVFSAKDILNEYKSSLFAIASKDHFAIILTILMAEWTPTTHICNTGELSDFLN